MWQKIVKRLRNQKGASMVEYALLSALIAVVVVGAIALLGDKIKTVFDTISGSL